MSDAGARVPTVMSRVNRGARKRGVELDGPHSATRAEREYRPTHDATEWARLDERVSTALAVENAYWRTDDARRIAIEQRCRDAGYGGG